MDCRQNRCIDECTICKREIIKVIMYYVEFVSSLKNFSDMQAIIYLWP